MSIENKKGDRVVNVFSGLTGTVVLGGACTVVDLDEGRQVRGDFRAWQQVALNNANNKLGQRIDELKKDNKRLKND